MGEADLISAMTLHGFSLNESRAYAALLQGGSATGYEVGQRARIPRSAVYGALRRLVSAGAARSIAGQPERFVASPAASLMALLRDRFDGNVQKLNDAVKSLDAEPPVPDAYSVRGYKRVLEEARGLILSAEKQLVLSGWPKELSALHEAIADADRKGVNTWVFSHAKLPPELPGIHFSYGLPERALEAFWKHRLVIVADDRRTLIAATEGGDGDVAVISETLAIAEVAVSQVALDVTLLAQRHHFETGDVMAQMLGSRVGRLDDLLSSDTLPELNHRVSASKQPAPEEN